MGEDQMTGISDFHEPSSQVNEVLGEVDIGNFNRENESKFRCNQCEKVFKTSTPLRRHENVHSGVKLACSVCQSTFSRKDKLNAHIKKKHSKLANDGILSEAGKNDEYAEEVLGEELDRKGIDVDNSAKDANDEAIT